MKTYFFAHKKLLGLTLIAVATLAFTFLYYKPAAANYGNPPIYHDYFNGNYLGNSGYLDVIDGGITPTTSKATFENEILAIHNAAQNSRNGQGWSRGANFIIQTMRGGTDHSSPNAAAIADWEARINSSDVRLSIDRNYCNYIDAGNDHNSGYLNGGVAWVNYDQCGEVIIFSSVRTGAWYYVVRVDCGNPLGDLGGLPAAPNHAPTGSLSASCILAADGSDIYRFSYTFSDADGTSTARTAAFLSAGAYAASDTGHAAPASYITASAPYTSGSRTVQYSYWPGQVGLVEHDVYLRVTDIQPDGSHSWVTVDGTAKPSCPAPPPPPAVTPYFNVVGGDVSAGAGYGSCTDDQTAGITAYNSGAAGGYKGSATTNGAFALSGITGFSANTNALGGASTAQSVAALLGRPAGLAFANTTIPPGSFGSLGCVPDYASLESQANGAIEEDGVTQITQNDINGMSNGVYTYNDIDSVSLGNLTIPAGKHLTFVIYGDANITGNIQYGPYTSIANAPRLTLIVDNSNINISSTVTRMDGFYVAQPQADSGGAIITCIDSTGSESIDPAVCSSPLVINGALSAGTIRFDRTLGNIGGPPAETINFSAELWGAGLDDCATDVTQCSNDTNAITGLPPVL